LVIKVASLARAFLLLTQVLETTPGTVFELTSLVRSFLFFVRVLDTNRGATDADVRSFPRAVEL
jgi:hypothetical protein